jgi:hypothetical protein
MLQAWADHIDGLRTAASLSFIHLV